MDGILAGLLTGGHELLVADSQLRHQLLQQVLNYFFEVLQRQTVVLVHAGQFCAFSTYIVDFGELKLVLVLVVEDGAVLIDEAHDGRLPTRGP